MEYSLRFRILAFSLALPAFPAFAARETLRFEIVSQADPDRKDTVAIWTDYAVFPAIPAPAAWGTWPATEKDSAWTSDSMFHLRYAHSFYAAKAGIVGSGWDYIYYDSPYPGGEPNDPHYEAQVYFEFGGADWQSWSTGSRRHFREEPRIPQPESGPIYPGNDGFIITKGGKETHALYLSRQEGWVGDGAPVTLAPRARTPKPGGGAARSEMGLSDPEGGVLRMFDARGRVLWVGRADRSGNASPPAPYARSGSSRSGKAP
jgi:hypothetical protein